VGRFGLSQPVLRSEDRRFLTGTGRYTADIVLPNQTHAVVLRSPHAHAMIAQIDANAALAMRGVLAVITAADLAQDGVGDIPCAERVRDEHGRPLPNPGRPVLARDRVRFVGEPVAMVVAESLAVARDAVERIVVDYDPLAAVASIEAATADGAPAPIWPDVGSNIAFYWELGSEEQADAALQEAAHVVRLAVRNNRVIPCPMEPRASIGSYDEEDGRYTLFTSSQGGHQIKDHLSQDTLKVPADRLHVIVPDVGGGFGTKIFHYPEEVLVLWASYRLRRPVKWVGDRSEAFLADTHGRDHRNRIVAGFDADGRFLALRCDTLANMGAYLNEFGPGIPTSAMGCMLSGAYAVPAIFATCRGVYTNTVPVDAYRGAGRPEAAYVVERLMDAAARQIGLAPDEIRRRNFVRPEQMPYLTATGVTYDSGDFARNLEDALVAAEWASFEMRREGSASRGRLRGIGLSCYVEICAYGKEQATLKCRSDGIVELLIGTQSTGQGHETAYAQIAADSLGIPFESIHVLQGDTDRIPFGMGTSGSRSIPVGGPAIQAACAALISRGEELTSHLLQAGDRSVRYEDGRFQLEGTDRGIGLAELAAALEMPENRPMDEHGRALSASARYKIGGSTFPNGTHVCEVEVDPETGVIEVIDYHVVDDFGIVVNPLLLAGQVYGGIAQGIGQALMEHAIYDPHSAQLLSGSFVDYSLPRASDIPPIDFRYNVVPCKNNPLGVKGAGEAGAIGACPAVVNAVLDALAPLGVEHVDMPLTPETIWRAITAARASSSQE
jgi:aerobic carbon-monoxide dehydrogenase large subunit